VNGTGIETPRWQEKDKFMPAGRKNFEPTEQLRRMVESLAGCGTRQDAIARITGIDAKTLRKHFRHELDCGADKANAQVANTLYKMATSGNCVAATIFWAKARNHWRETSRAQHRTDTENPMSTAVARALLAQATRSRPKEDENEQPITN
jgi:hypothetical protein